jgi:hypothetical protein
VNVLAVNRSDEGLIELFDNVVRDDVALVFDRFDLVGVPGAIVEIGKEFFE